jgi:hypothetical protein
MSVRILSVVVLALLLGTADPGRAQDEAISEARDSAKTWLALLDDGQYEATWENAGELLKAAVGPEEWAKKWSVTLGPLGKLKSRAVRSSEYSTTMPGGPEGEYVVVQFDTTFESGQTALENVVMRKQRDGTWKVAGYRIR